MMTLQEMKLAVCEKLPELITVHNYDFPVWKGTTCRINWPTEGLQVCHEAVKKLSVNEWSLYLDALEQISHPVHICPTTHTMDMVESTYEQRLEALCRVWWPERFN